MYRAEPDDRLYLCPSGHVRRHDDVSCDVVVSPPKPVRDDRAAGDSATRLLKDRLLVGSHRDERRKT